MRTISCICTVHSFIGIGQGWQIALARYCILGKVVEETHLTAVFNTPSSQDRHLVKALGF